MKTLICKYHVQYVGAYGWILGLAGQLFFNKIQKDS